jgi:hypothetical protein
MDQNLIMELLQNSRKKPKLILKHDEQLEYEATETKREVVELPKGDKVVVESWVETITVRKIRVREFDPSANYQDAIETFMDSE